MLVYHNRQIVTTGIYEVDQYPRKPRIIRAL